MLYIVYQEDQPGRAALRAANGCVCLVIERTRARGVSDGLAARAGQGGTDSRRRNA